MRIARSWQSCIGLLEMRCPLEQAPICTDPQPLIPNFDKKAAAQIAGCQILSPDRGTIASISEDLVLGGSPLNMMARTAWATNP